MQNVKLIEKKKNKRKSLEWRARQRVLRNDTKNTIHKRKNE